MEKVIAAVAAVVLAFGVYLIGTAIDDNSAPAQTAATSPTAASTGTNDAIVTANSQAAAGHVHTATGTAAAGVDDRGFSKLENGEQHAHSFTQAISPADRVELARQLSLAR